MKWMIRLRVIQPSMLLLLAACAHHPHSPEPRPTRAFGSTYEFYRVWAEERSPAKAVPEAAPIFVMSLSQTNYGEIVPHRIGITLSEVLSVITFPRKVAAVTVYRARNVIGQGGPGSGWVFGLDDAPHCRIEAQDVLQLHTETPVITR